MVTWTAKLWRLPRKSSGSAPCRAQGMCRLHERRKCGDPTAAEEGQEPNQNLGGGEGVDRGRDLAVDGSRS